MSTTSPTQVSPQPTGQPRPPASPTVWRHGMAASVAAAAVVLAGAALAEALGVKFTDRSGSAIHRAIGAIGAIGRPGARITSTPETADAR